MRCPFDIEYPCRNTGPRGGGRIVAFILCLNLLFLAPARAAERDAWTRSRVAGSPRPPTPLAVERIFARLQFTNPVDMAWAPGGARWWVADQMGRLWSFPPQPETAHADLALDLREHRQPLEGVLGFTFHPKFKANGYVFINYNEPGGRTNGAVVARFTVARTDPPTIDPASERIIIRWTSGGHNGCTLAFGNDGFLYISTGDGADPDPPDGHFRTGQDISDLLSSVLRIDVDRADGPAAYSVPRDNPFAHTANARPEVYAFGFRNPFRMSIDSATGDLWVGDVGWEQWEMIYRVKAGGNYGWSITEGPNANVRTGVKQGPGPILPALVALPHTDAASITGGRVYHGHRLPQFRGAYVYGDWETGRFWGLRHRGDRLTANDVLCDTSLKPVAFGEAPDRELVILDYNGGLYRFVANPAATSHQPFPRQLSQTGLYRSLAPLEPEPGVIPFRIAAPMWSDAASAEYVLAIPERGTIVTRGGVGNIAGSTWSFPTNTVLAKTLSLATNSAAPMARRRVETQLLHWDGQRWNPYSYRWRSDQSEADLVLEPGTNDVFSVTDATAPGGERRTSWRYLTRNECLRCHNAWAGETLTLSALQLGPPPRDGSAPSELQRLVSLGAIEVRDLDDSRGHLVDPYDTAAPLAARARSWLHVNCASCHRFGAGGGVAAQFPFELPLEKTRAIDVRPTRGDFGLVGAQIISSGDPYRSVLFYRVCTEGPGHMPHIGSRLTDNAGVALLRDWIQSLPPPAVGPPAADAVAARRLQQMSRSALQQWPGTPDSPTLPDVLSTVNGALAVADALSTGPGDNAGLRKEALAQTRAHTNAMVRTLFERFLPPDERRAVLGLQFDPQTVLALPGNAERGRRLFLTEGSAQCARCHRLAGEGQTFGPELTGIGRKYSRAQLLEQILQPSKIIAPEYRLTILKLKDDSELSGFLARRTPGAVVLREVTGERAVPQSEIADTRESTLSAMPEGLLAPLTAAEAADLLAYLSASTAGPAGERKAAK